MDKRQPSRGSKTLAEHRRNTTLYRPQSAGGALAPCAWEPESRDQTWRWSVVEHLTRLRNPVLQNRTMLVDVDTMWW